ncbi:MAG: YHS domain-containing (seleno)protein [Burkholderiaceae bacterium]
MNPLRALQQIVVAFALLVIALGASLAQSNSAALRVVLKGHDPVAYFTEGRPVKGSPSIGHDWDGERYLFATVANRDKFVADPERYAPQFGGYCTGSMAKGVRLEADPEAWIISGGRLYVFGQVKFRDMAKNDSRYLSEKIAAAKHNWRAHN